MGREMRQKLILIKFGYSDQIFLEKYGITKLISSPPHYHPYLIISVIYFFFSYYLRKLIKINNFLKENIT